ncbi:bacteriochlorophyll 4-vinyl reductase [Pseudooctadecabacter jejudonensis]|nr:bacteriochlorophyll 4-vinyl reductase [Pseudooctadecabacter jejudonensis]
MAEPLVAPLRRPNRSGFMAPFLVLEMVAAIGSAMGADSLEEVLKEAQLYRLPDADEPVREDKVARLHQAMRRKWPDEAVAMSTRAGAEAGQRIMETQITTKAQGMLAKMPRATGAWLLAKTARQNAWTFSGSGEFVVESENRFILRENPILVGETSEVMVCDFHASLFERLFSTLIHPRLVCRETQCHARGDEACVFEFTMSEA